MVDERLSYIPIDFIKAEIIGMNKSQFSKNPLLGNPKSIFKGERLVKTIYKFENISIRVYENSNRIEFLGSLHTFINDGQNNYTDFPKSSFIKAIEKLKRIFEILPENLRIIQLEWGFNIRPPKPSKYILDRLIQHRKVNKTTDRDSQVDGRFIQFKHSTMRLKVYDKALQNKLNYELLRVEIKQTNWSKYRKLGIKTLKDFIETNKSVFYIELINQWERTIFYDIDDSISRKYIKYQTSIYWNNLRETCSNKTFKYHFDKLEKLNSEIGHNTKRKVSNLMLTKGNEFQLKGNVTDFSFNIGVSNYPCSLEIKVSQPVKV